MKKAFKIVALVVIAFSFATCATLPGPDGSGGHTTDTKNTLLQKNAKLYTAALNAGQYDTCIDLLKATNKNYEKNIQLSYDIALAEHYKKDYASSAERMNKTDALLHDAFTKSITQNIGAATLNENIVEYPGNIYEYLLINAFNAMNYYNQGNLEDALVEVRKIAIKQKEYINKYGEVVLSNKNIEKNASMQQSLSNSGISMNQLESIKPKEPVLDDIYRDSAFARYLSMILRLSYGDADNAVIDARVLATLKPEMDVRKEISIPKDSGRVNVLAFSGVIGERYGEEVYFPSESDYIYLPRISGIEIPPFNLKFAYPEFEFGVDKVDSVSIEISNNEKKDLNLLEDFDMAVAKDVRCKAPAAFTRSFFRVLGKKTAAAATGAAAIVAANELANNMDGIAAIITVASVKVTAFAGLAALNLTETADVRQCINIPNKVHCGYIDLAPGHYSIKVLYKKGENVISEEYFENILVQAGKPVILESLCIK